MTMAVQVGPTGLPTIIRPALLRLVRIAVELGATEAGGPLTPLEHDLVRQAMEIPKPENEELERVRQLAADGKDPLGDAFLTALSPAERRPRGAVYTPPALVSAMVAWVLARIPDRVVDAGAGSGRFAVATARARPDVDIIAVEIDPVATLVCRANVAMAGVRSVRVVQQDYTRLYLPPIAGRTAFVGNPPYVRHHDLDPASKTWAKAAARRLGLQISGLAGLHVYFYLATALAARPGDIGCFITSAEWFDVAYGRVLRQLLTGALLARSFYLFDPEVGQFDGTMTTAVISCFEAGGKVEPVGVRFVRKGQLLGDLSQTDERLPVDALRRVERWSTLFPRAHAVAAPTVVARATRPNNFVRLGSLMRVSRGVATGHNGFFVMTAEEARRRGLARFARPAITEASEVFLSPGIIRATPARKVIVDLPAEASLDRAEAESIRAYIREGEALGVPKRYLCAHRKPWWRLGIRNVPRAVATYMARQAPAFAMNPDGLVILNVLHGLYPRVPMTDRELFALVTYLNANRESLRGEGRTYHGGLEKFEPGEMESLHVPSLELLKEMAKALGAVLAGVYKLANLKEAQQAHGVALFWEHNLQPLLDFIAAARP